MLDLNNPKDVHVDERLKSAQIMWISTVRNDGQPKMAPVWFFWEEGRILIFSEPKTQKIKNLQRNNKVTLSLDSTNDGADVVIIEGEAELKQEAINGSLLQKYAQKYAGGLKGIGLTQDQMVQQYSVQIWVTPKKFIRF